MAGAQQANQPSRHQPGKVGKNRFAHTANTPFGMGDHYGPGVKNPIGRMRENQTMMPLPKSKLHKPPRKLA